MTILHCFLLVTCDICKMCVKRVQITAKWSRLLRSSHCLILFVIIFQGNTTPVDLKVLLPDREIVTVTVRKNSSANEVYQAVVDRINISSNAAKYFYLFEIVEYNFGAYLRYSVKILPLEIGELFIPSWNY